MRTFDAVVSLGLIGLALGLPPAASFDGMPEAPVAVAPPNAAIRDLRPMEPSLRSGSQALQSGTRALRDGKRDEAVIALEYAARQGVPGAMWKLGRMYADGDGVDRNALRAFEYFRDLTMAHAYDPPNTLQARFAANAFVSLGRFYLDGIVDTYVKADPVRARQLYTYAASYFADSDAQYQLTRLYLDGIGGPKNARQAVRWVSTAANKGHHQAQALLGTVLFEGRDVPRQAALGLAWLTV